MARETIHIVLAADDNYAMPLATTMRSVVETHTGKQPLHFFVLSDGIESKSRRKIRESCPSRTSIEFIDCSELDLQLPEQAQQLEHLTRATCIRAMVDELIPESVERVLYLDTDLLILTDVEELWNTPLRKGSVFGAVVDAAVPTHGSSRKRRAAHPRGSNDAPYFNAGVLVIDMSAWRANRIGRRTLEVLGAPDSVLPFVDQDALNYVADGLWTSLDPAWNCAADYYYGDWDHRMGFGNPLPYSHIEPKILHFCGKNKPWRNDYPFREGFRSYRVVRDRTLWPTGVVGRIRGSLKLR